MKYYITIFRKKIILISLLIVIRQLLLVLAQRLNAEIFEGLVEMDFNFFMYILIAMIATWVIVISLDAINKVFEEDLLLNMQINIRRDITQKMIDTDYQSFNTYSSGNYLSWLNDDVKTISEKGLRQYFNLTRGASGVIFASIALLQYHWLLLLTTIVGFICMYFIPKIFNKKIYETSAEVTKANEQFVEKMEDQLKGYSVYFVYAKLGELVSSINKASQSLKRVMMKQVKLETLLHSTNFSVNVFFQILLTFVAAVSYFNNWVNVGAVAIVGSLADIIFSGLGSMSFQISSMKSVVPIFDKYDQLVPEEIQRLDSNNNNHIYEADSLSLEFNNELIFSDLSFNIEPKDKVLIQGVSGSGKSSLVKLLLGYYRNYNGVLKYKEKDIKNVSSKLITQQVIYLSQDTYLFQGTVRENIELGDFFTQKQLIETLDKVGLNPELFLDITIKTLSGGQRQKVALARALIRRPEVLICDEITSSLDKESSILIENLLLSLSELTVIMITHKLYSQEEKFNKKIQLSYNSNA